MLSSRVEKIYREWELFIIPMDGPVFFKSDDWKCKCDLRKDVFIIGGYGEDIISVKIEILFLRSFFRNIFGKVCAKREIHFKIRGIVCNVVEIPDLMDNWKRKWKD